VEGEGSFRGQGGFIQGGSATLLWSTRNAALGALGARDTEAVLRKEVADARAGDIERGGGSACSRLTDAS